MTENKAFIIIKNHKEGIPPPPCILLYVKPFKNQHWENQQSIIR